MPRDEKGGLEAVLDTSNKDHKVELVLKREAEPDEGSIDLKALLMKLIKERKIVVFMTLLALVAGAIWNVVSIARQEYVGTASSIIAFNFKGVDKGLDPLGKTFDISEIKSAQVLDQTISEMELGEKGITVDALKRNLTISGIMPKDVMDRVLIIHRMAEKDASKLEKLTELEYHPVEYKIDLVIPREFGIGETEARQILNTLMDNYKEYFMEKYSDRKALDTAINTIDFNRYDYSEFVMLAESQIGVIKNYVRLKATQSPDFRAKATQMTFGDILSQISILEGVELNRIQSLVNSFMLTKDADKMIAIYENSITKKTLEMTRKEEQAKNLREQANSYKKDTSIMLMPGTAEMAPVEVNESSRTYDTLVENASVLMGEAAQLKTDIAYYSQIVQRLRNKEASAVPENAAQAAKYQKEVEAQVEYLTKAMADIVELTNNTVDEYFETEVFKDAVKVNVPASYRSMMDKHIKSAALSIGIAAMLGLMAGLLIALGKGILKDQDQNKTSSL